VAEITGFEVLVLAKEINSALQGTYVNNVYSLGPSQLVRFRKQNSEDVWLVVSPKKGVWVSEIVSERADTTEFTSKLRSELERAKFSGASQFDMDRVFELDFHNGEGRRLVVELMPPGNIIVLDSQGRVSLALNEVRSEARRITRGVAYQPPRQGRMSPLDVQAADVRVMVEAESTVGKGIGRHVALPRKYVSEALSRLGVSDESPSSSLAGREEEVARVLKGMVAQVAESPKPCMCETPRGDEIFVIPPSGLEVKMAAKSVSELCDRLLLREAQETIAQPEPEDAKRKELEATISKLRAESESLLAQASKVRSSAAAARTSGLADALRILADSGVLVAREPASPAAVASVLYDEAKELEAKSARNLAAAARLERRVSRTVPEKRPLTKPIARKRGEWYEKFRWFITSEGKLAIGGRDAQTNSTLLGRHLDSNDTVFHADLFGSPFFVLKGGSGQSEGEVRQMALATVAFSSAWKTGLGSADAYWVAPGQISSAAPSGEYLPRGSFAIKGKKNFVTKNIVEVAVGLDPDGRVMAGPEEAVKLRCTHYVVLRPQREKGSDTAKRVLKDLLAAPGSQRRPSLDEVQRALPTGGGKIIRRA
jgi:predicted ribosome quality control (RQC) complex YloA/Tae2 family protein